VLVRINDLVIQMGRAVPVSVRSVEKAQNWVIGESKMEAAQTLAKGLETAKLAGRVGTAESNVHGSGGEYK
jgi:hypothetical protein